jgi:RNA polymerase sigma-70 factor (ECF subfamily)
VAGRKDRAGSGGQGSWDGRGETVPPPETLANWIAGAKNGDREAFERLAAAYRERLATVVFLKLGAHVRQAVEVEDVLQESFLRALRDLQRFEWRGGDSFFQWVRTIAEHVILESVNRLKVRKAAPLEGEVADEVTSQSRALRREERFDRLQSALRSLSPDHRKVILLAKVERLAIQDIARVMDRSPDAVSNLLARALRKLKETFGETESLHLPDRALGEEPT